MEIIIIAGVLTALGAATRGIWSPCGLSMLTSINPISERGRQHRFGVTAGWFIVGGVLGGLTLGIVAALVSALVSALALSLEVRVAIGAAAAFLAVLLDVGALGVRVPVIRRQVNERWLDEFRGWFYGIGFGWQIGVGFATYVMTAAVGLVVLLAALTAQPAIALSICVLFGLVRGCWVLLTARIRTPEGLRTLLGRLDRHEEPVRRAVMILELALGTLLAAAWSGWIVAATLCAGVATVTALFVLSRPDARSRRSHRAALTGRMLPGLRGATDESRRRELSSGS